MRFFRMSARLACLVMLVAIGATTSIRLATADPAGDGWSMRVERDASHGSQTTKPAQTEPFQVRLGFSDERAALQALQFALNEVGDGSTFVWHRKAGVLSGTIRPTAAFVDDKERLCRHVVLSLTAGDRKSTIEGIACRTPQGHWQL